MMYTVVDDRRFSQIVCRSSVQHDVEADAEDGYTTLRYRYMLHGVVGVYIVYSKSASLRNQPLETQCWIWAQFLSGY